MVGQTACKKGNNMFPTVLIYYRLSAEGRAKWTVHLKLTKENSTFVSEQL